MKTLTIVSLLLTCGLLPFILTQPTAYYSPEDGSIGDTLWNMVVLPLQQIRHTLAQIQDSIHNSARPRCTTSYSPNKVPVGFTPRDCADWYRAGYEESGVYNVFVYIAGYSVPVPVYCDMETDGGGWLVFQRRQDGSVDFFRNWNDYAKGFGNITGEFWLGNDLLHLFSDHEPQQLRVDLRDHEGHTAYASYGHFYVGPQMSDYILNVSIYSGNAGSSLAYHNRRKFSTKDRDNDGYGSSCALLHRGGWWFHSCLYSNLNGLWAPTGQHNGTAQNQYINWRHWRGRQYSILFSEMKMRPLSF